jgi:hypothetical protein
MAHRMYHPEHGYEHAYDSAALKRMQDAGWKIQSDKEFKDVLAAKLGAKDEVEGEAEPEAPKKRGRPKANA